MNNMSTISAYAADHYTADIDGEDIYVADSNGGVWYPDTKATAEILRAADPTAEAIAIADLAPNRGEWVA